MYPVHFYDWYRGIYGARKRRRVRTSIKMWWMVCGGGVKLWNASLFGAIPISLCGWVSCQSPFQHHPRCTDSIYGYVVLTSLSRIPTGPSGRSQGACKQTLDATLGSYSGVRMTRIKSCVPENNPKVSVGLGQGVKITSEHVSFAWVVPRGC